MSLESISKEFTGEQQKVQELMQLRQKLETQYQENLSVEQEFKNLDDSSNIYKLVGPVLLPQEFAEAQLNVSKRIEFILKEVKRVEDQISAKNQLLEKLRDEIIAIRTKGWFGARAFILYSSKAKVRLIAKQVVSYKC